MVRSTHSAILGAEELNPAGEAPSTSEPAFGPSDKIYGMWSWRPKGWRQFTLEEKKPVTPLGEPKNKKIAQGG